MDQRFEGTPLAELKVDGKSVVRTAVSNDWGSQLLWEVRRDGQVVSTANARLSEVFTLPESTPGSYEVVLQMWKYDGYEKTPDGEFTKSKYVEVSNKVVVTV
jgi:hypothetical protein